MIRYTTGDLLNVKKGVIAHGVNCRGAFGSGVAGQIRKVYPWAYKDYDYKHKREGWKLGDVQFCVEDHNDEATKRGDCLVIANCATQDNFGTYKVQVDYQAVETCINKLLDFCEKFKMPLALPKIGAGLAGGDWDKINGIIQACAQEREVDITIYSYEITQPNSSALFKKAS